jgi:LCP family protein required for cell wall assembly
MNDKQTLQPERSKTITRLKWVLLGAFLIAALITAYLTFIAVRDFVTSWELTSLPGITIREDQATSTPDAAGVIHDVQTPLQPVGGPTPEPWDGASRVTMLVMGLDYRDWEAGLGAPRTDSMILVTLDPLDRTAGVLSIPRDMWVNIPGFGYGRINTAYSLGEGAKLPGGGPALAMTVVEGLIGTPIDYYAQIDFNTFIRFIDEIGGVKITIEKRMKVDTIGGKTKLLRPGTQVLNGELALGYARARNTEGGDFDRAFRQQEVIIAVRNQLLRGDLLLSLISKSPVLYQELSSGVRTNLTLDQAIKLAWLVKQIPKENIKRGIIGPPDQVLLVESSDGDKVLKPIADQIRLLRDTVFFHNRLDSPAATDMDPIERVKAEAPKIQVLNGSTTTGLASQTLEYLQSQGITADAGNAEQVYNNTTIFDYTGKIYTVQYLVDLLQISPNRVYSRYDPTSQVDVVVILGLDWTGISPPTPSP